MRAELRIGNIVTDEYYDTFKKEIVVDSLNENGINISAADDGKPYGMHSPTLEVEYEYDKLRGIPLTEEWLIKFGFEKQRSPMYWRNKEFPDLEVYFDSKGELAIQLWGDEVVLYLRTVKYVHDFQNFMHLLNGSEPSIKETV